MDSEAADFKRAWNVFSQSLVQGKKKMLEYPTNKEIIKYPNHKHINTQKNSRFSCRLCTKLKVSKTWKDRWLATLS